MKKRKKYLPCILAVVLFGAFPALSQTMNGADRAREPDNTGVNKSDRAQDGITADQASQKKSDIELMQNIRKAIMEDASLSTTAKNVKIIAVDGRVTLKGPVNSDEERQSIHTKASDIAGMDNVVDRLSIKSAK